jgi:hypothetical protein
MSNPEQTITEVTRRAIIDILSIATPWRGVLDDHDFLTRLYDLSQMQSTDYRFKDASGDIFQHRIRNQDWSDEWVFTDSRFNLLRGSDEPFLKFLAETVHPIVRPDRAIASEIVREYNSHLVIDGWELYVVREISKRPVFGYRRIADAAKRLSEVSDQIKVAESQSHHPKVFVSHATLDHPFVEKFAADLRTKGVDAWFSKWEIKPGDSIRQKIEEGLEGCEYFIVVLSKNSINRPWVQKELDAATVRNIAGKVRKIIPIKIEDCGDLPATLGSLCWEDFSNQPYDAALKRVLDSIFGVDVRPPLGQPPMRSASAAPMPIPPSVLRRTATQFPISALATGVFVNELRGEGFDAAGDVHNGQVGIIVGPRGLDRKRMPENEIGIFFPLWELNYEGSRPLVEARRFHDLVESRPRDWVFNRPYRTGEHQLEQPAAQHLDSTRYDADLRLVGPHEVDIVLESVHSKAGHGIAAKILNRRAANLFTCEIMVRDARSFDGEKGVLRESENFRPVRITREDCAAGFEGKGHWLIRTQGDHLEIGDTTNQGVLPWPTGDKSNKQRWRLFFSVKAKELEQWTPEVDLEWVSQSDAIGIRVV